MNISTINKGSGTLFVGNLQMLQGTTLKSTQNRMERQQKANSQIEFWQNQKENLKNMECGSVEEIAKKLEMLHTYEDEIASVKAAYNNEQVFHVLDEAREQGEKIAEAAEKSKPKTEEERKEEIREEILGTEEGEGILQEILEEAVETMEEMQEEQLEEVAEEAVSGETSNMVEKTVGKDFSKNPEEIIEGDFKKMAAETADRELEEVARETGNGSLKDMPELMQDEEWMKHYRPMDIRI